MTAALRFLLNSLLLNGRTRGSRTRGSRTRGLCLGQVLTGWIVMMGLSGSAIAEPPLPSDSSVNSGVNPGINSGVNSSLNPTALDPNSALNPCPGIYYEPPHNKLHVVPAHCPPNLATQRLGPQGQHDGIGGEFGSLPPQLAASPGFVQESSLNPPLPGTQQDVIAMVRPEQGQVSIVLTNNTATEVTYQVLGHFAPRTLAASESILLRGVPAPATLTLVRPDGGFLNVTPLDPTETQQLYGDVDSSALLSLALNASGQFDTVQGALTIEQDGRVFIQ